jgi:hypothetical protein
MNLIPSGLTIVRVDIVLRRPRHRGSSRKTSFSGVPVWRRLTDPDRSPISRGPEGSNPCPSSGESTANLPRTAVGEKVARVASISKIEFQCFQRALSRKPGREPRAYRIGCRHGSALLPPSSLSARDNPARDLAVSPLHPELSRCRGIAGRTSSEPSRPASSMISG